MTERRGRWLLAVLVAAPGAGAVAQAPAAAPIRVFLDCQNTRCDFDFFRRELAWVDWVRDRADAQVHVLVTSQGTGGGGREYTFRLLGQTGFAGRDHDLRANTQSEATDDEVRRAMAGALKLGLAAYAGALPIGQRLDVRFDAPVAGTPARVVDDPWNYWSFRVGVDGFIGGESQSRSSRVSGSVRATRTTDDWKVRIVAWGNRSENDFVLSDGTTLETVTTGNSVSGLVVRSLGDHWSVGVDLSTQASDRENLDRLYQFAPGIEYNLWPYRESSRRQLTFLYEIGLVSARYIDTTIYNVTRESFAGHQLRISLVQREPWGTSRFSLEGANYLDDWSLNRVTLFGELEFRVTRGLSVELSGSYARVRDQRSLPKEGATDEEILLRLRELQTDYEYDLRVGLSYTFGSIFNNIVNPRFGGGDRFF